MLELTIEVSAEEVNTEATRFRVGVRAQSIQQAVDVVRMHYPGAAVRVIFPLDPETFFVKDDVSVAQLTRMKTSKRLAS